MYNLIKYNLHDNEYDVTDILTPVVNALNGDLIDVQLPTLHHYNSDELLQRFNHIRDVMNLANNEVIDNLNLMLQSPIDEKFDYIDNLLDRIESHLSH